MVQNHETLGTGTRAGGFQPGNLYQPVPKEAEFKGKHVFGANNSPTLSFSFEIRQKKAAPASLGAFSLELCSGEETCPPLGWEGKHSPSSQSSWQAKGPFPKRELSP